MNPIRAFGVTLVAAGFASAIGVVRGAGLVDRVRALLPPSVRVMLAACLVGLATLLGLAAVVLAGRLAWQFGTMLDMQAALGAGGLGGLVLLVIELGYLPVAVVWTASYALGAPLALTRDATVSPFVSSPIAADLPPLPLLAGLPSDSTPFAWAMPTIAIAAGIVLGMLVARRGPASALTRATLAVGAALVAALLMAVLARVSIGSLGSEHLVRLGPDSQIVAILTAIALVMGGVPSALLGRRPGRRERRDRPDLVVVPPAPEVTAPEATATPDSVATPNDAEVVSAQ